MWLAYVHPAAMTIGLLGAAWVLRMGLLLRRARLRAGRRDPALRRRHTQVAPYVVGLLLLGFISGPLSSILLRDWTPFERLHGFVAGLALALFAATGWQGWQLKTGRSRAVDRHGWLGLMAVLVGALTAVTGFVLLP